jgi:hypothetical protein
MEFNEVIERIIELQENKVFNVEAFGSCSQSDGKVTEYL